MNKILSNINGRYMVRKVPDFNVLNNAGINASDVSNICKPESNVVTKDEFRNFTNALASMMKPGVINNISADTVNFNSDNENHISKEEFQAQVEELKQNLDYVRGLITEVAHESNINLDKLKPNTQQPEQKPQTPSVDVPDDEIINLDDVDVHGSLRISLGSQTHFDDVDGLVEAIKESVATLRKMSPLWNSDEKYEEMMGQSK